jgi:hypothetical protein
MYIDTDILAESQQQQTIPAIPAILGTNINIDIYISTYT